MTRPVGPKPVPPIVAPAHDPADRDDNADAEVFAREMRDVARLKPDLRGRIREAPAASLPAVGAEPDSGGDDASQPFAGPGVDRRELKKLKRGDYPPEATADLHGLTGDEACERVGHFLQNSRHGGRRCVCIIHGRGLHSDGGAPVLKTRIRSYLRSHAAVLAYTDAPSAAGGPGAVYVLLRR